ncbi:D,D-dipeptide ABC transport system permease protein DdpB [Thermacetogenium phaeum DSM 12270]|uniref:D,D-dipeptide ABC transport system permease protein DdpB n=1 Tax=Thermacetogenium phaeum (strain ATCC BAA-254 / DSM 26808 / PB) TaxID=1089553 RepID=K4LGD4_THEPS|nr:ABC transporter permease [Thermacetogenium phaeum]AFV11913.1 D,D-dipeptide ABC transport system permease protein DdpB [Thermacetogenium phaeum DSM 12270]
MGINLLKRIGLSIFVLFGLSILIFFISRVVPGDPARLALGPRAPEWAVENLRQEMHLDKPLYVQYALWLNGFVHGDLGKSLVTRRPVTTDIKEFLPATLEIVILSAIVLLVGGVFLGIISAKFTNTWLDGLIRIISYLGIVSPAFVWAIIFVLIFGYALPIFPTMERLSPGVTAPPTVTGMYTVDSLLAGDMSTFVDAFKHLVLPAIALAMGGMAQAARITRSSMLDNMGKDYIAAEKAYGIPEGLVFVKYLLKPSLIPTVSVASLDIAALFGNAFLVELIFNYPGFSRYGITAMLNKDLNAIAGVIMILGIIFVTINIIIDFIVAYLDPRIGLAGR